MLNPWITSEVHSLTHLLLGRPSSGIQHLTDCNQDKYLFNGIPNVDVICEEHNEFVNLLKYNNIIPIFVEDLLCESLKNIQARQWILNQLIPFATIRQPFLAIKEILFNLDASTLAHYLINGVKFSEIMQQDSIQKMDMEGFLFHPLPNHYFTRDTSIWLHDGVIIGAMRHAIRRREALIMSCIYRYSAWFNHTSPCKIWFDGSLFHYNEIYLEGGDLMLICEHTLLIGQSERTSYNAIHILAETLLNQSEIKHIIVVELPKVRHCIHLDMVLTMVNHNTFSISKTLLEQNQNVWDISYDEDSMKIEVNKHSNLINLLHKRLNNEINIITLDDEKLELDEQKNYANNLLAINPGHVISYEHNYYTNYLLNQSGIEVTTIPSSQLILGHGGAHCMSCPVIREQ